MDVDEGGVPRDGLRHADPIIALDRVQERVFQIDASFIRHCCMSRRWRGISRLLVVVGGVVVFNHMIIISNVFLLISIVFLLGLQDGWPTWQPYHTNHTMGCVHGC